MKVIGCVNVYQDATLLARCLAALRPHVDTLVVVDGAYAGFERYGADPASTDGTLELARFAADIVLSAAPGDDEIAKRNKYLVGAEGDYYFVVDADEEVDGVLDRAALSARDDWAVALYRAQEPWVRYPIYRLFRHRTGIAYRGMHCGVHVGDEFINPNKRGIVAPGSEIPGLALKHDLFARDADRQRRKNAYYASLRETERAFREAHGF